jgi:hypothetical protein
MEKFKAAFWALCSLILVCGGLFGVPQARASGLAGIRWLLCAWVTATELLFFNQFFLESATPYMPPMPFQTVDGDDAVGFQRLRSKVCREEVWFNCMNLMWWTGTQTPLHDSLHENLARTQATHT